MRRLLLLVVCVAAAFLANTPSARGVAVTITYEIGAGSFYGPYSSGPITGGTVVVRYPNAVSLFSGPAPASLLALTLTGPSGYFQVPSSAFVSPNTIGAFLASAEDLIFQTIYRPAAPLELVSGPTLHTITETRGSLLLMAEGSALFPRTQLQGYIGLGRHCVYRCGPEFRHSFFFSTAHGFEVSRTCDTPPCPARAPLPLVGDLPMCKSKRGKQVTVLVPESKVRRSLDKGFFTRGECLNAANGRVLCKSKRGKRVNVLLPDSRVQGALDKGFCTLGECETD